MDNIISGVLYDFAGFLTTRPKAIVCGEIHDATLMVEALKEFFELRGIDDNNPMIKEWEAHLANRKMQSNS